MFFYPSDGVIETMMILNSFGQRFDPNSIPSYFDWSINSTFNPFSSEPSSPGIPLHIHPRSGFYAKEGVNVDNPFDHCRRPSKDTTRIVPKEVSSDWQVANSRPTVFQRSRFSFAQKRVGLTVGIEVNKTSVSHVYHRYSVDRDRFPIPAKATPVKVPRVVGPRPRPSKSGSVAICEPRLVSPKPVYKLPMWLTHFEYYEDELLDEFCPSPKNSTSSASSTPAMVGAEQASERALGSSPPNDTPPMGYAGSESEYDPIEFDASSNQAGCELVELEGCLTRATAFGWQAPSYMEEDEDAGLGEIIISPRSPVFDGWSGKDWASRCSVSRRGLDSQRNY